LRSFSPHRGGSREKKFRASQPSALRVQRF
jgi:hypothetical protein